MFDKTAHRPNSLPGGEHKRFEKTRSRRIYPAIWGLGDSPQQASRWQLLATGALLALNPDKIQYNSYKTCH